MGGSLFHMGQLFFFQQEVQHPEFVKICSDAALSSSSLCLYCQIEEVESEVNQKGLLCLNWHPSCTKTARYHFFLLSGFLWAGALDFPGPFFSERCFFCSKHGRFDTSESGIRNVARLVLQHGDGSELRGASGAGSKLHSVHRGLPASARFVKRYFRLMGMETAANVFVRFAKTCQSNFGPCVFSFQ